MKVFLYIAIVFCLFDITASQNRFPGRYQNRNGHFEYVDEMYRKPTERELRSVAVDSDLVEKYRGFLSKENSGILRLVPDFGCDENRNIIVAKAECLEYSMPGAGTAFSFRKDRYRVRRLADLIYKNGIFFSGSRYTQGILGYLGNAELENITLKTPGVKQLREYVPSSQYKNIEQEYKSIERGVIVSGVVFSNRLRVDEGNSYILRSIAYRGRSYISVGPYVTYDEFEYDKRIDILIAFRVLRKDREKGVTILWKELERKDAPKITFPKNTSGK